MSKDKKQLDMLHGSLWSKVPVFVLPVAATAILEQLFNASDVAVVGNFTGEQSTAVLIFISLLCAHPARKRLKKQASQQEQTV